MNQPPQWVIDEAIELAKRSPCQKSKRGAVIYDRSSEAIIAGGWNTPPQPRFCDGSIDCQASCSKRCLHAEDNAITGIGIELDDASEFDLVHAKVVYGKLAAGKGPSCWQCSRRILARGIGGVWLYQTAPFSAQVSDPDMIQWPAWVRWDSVEFDRQTRITCGVY